MSNSVRDGIGPKGPLSWSRTVTRELVHRTSPAEVLLTDVRPSDGGFEAAASWPRSHPTFPHDGGSLHSPLVLVETLRQLGIYIPLRYFRVSAAAHLLITDLFFDIDRGAEPEAGFGGTEVVCRIAVPTVYRDAAGAVTGLRLAVTFLVKDVAFAHAGGGARFLGEQRYAALRQLPHRVSPHDRGQGFWPVPDGLVRPAPSQLGVAGERDVLIGYHRDATVVGPADPLHPFFVDHAGDHVPGMVLLEAARQAAAATSHGALLRPRAGRLHALQFTEFTPAARVVCVPHHRTCTFGVLQGPARTAFGVLLYP
jgi:hypothetical protein